MRRFLTVMALMALLTMTLGGEVLASHCYPPGSSGCHDGGGGGGGPITPPGPPPDRPPASPSESPPGQPPDRPPTHAKASTPAATGDMVFTGGGWGKGVPLTITYANGRTISGVVNPQPDASPSPSASGASASGSSQVRNASALRVVTATDGTFTATVAMAPGDDADDTVLVVSGTDAAGDAHIVAVQPGQQANSLGAVAGDPQAALDAAVAHTGVLAATGGGPFTVGGAITVTLILAGAGLLLVTRRRSRSEM